MGKQLFQQRQVIYSETERQALIFCSLIQKSKNYRCIIIKIFRRFERHYFSGHQKVRHQLATENIALSYERKRGFYLEGDEFRIRRFGKNWLARLLQQKSGTFALLAQSASNEPIRKNVTAFN